MPLAHTEPSSPRSRSGSNEVCSQRFPDKGTRHRSSPVTHQLPARCGASRRGGAGGLGLTPRTNPCVGTIAAANCRATVEIDEQGFLAQHVLSCGGTAAFGMREGVCSIGAWEMVDRAVDHGGWHAPIRDWLLTHRAKDFVARPRSQRHGSALCSPNRRMPWFIRRNADQSRSLAMSLAPIRGGTPVQRCAIPNVPHLAACHTGGGHERHWPWCTAMGAPRPVGCAAQKRPPVPPEKRFAVIDVVVSCQTSRLRGYRGVVDVIGLGRFRENLGHGCGQTACDQCGQIRTSHLSAFHLHSRAVTLTSWPASKG